MEHIIGLTEKSKPQVKKLVSSCKLRGGGVTELGIPRPRSEALPALIVLVTLDKSLNLPEFQCPHL